MIGHVKILAWLHIFFGALGIVAGLIVVLVFGGIAGIVGAAGASDDAVVAAPIIGTIGGIIFLILFVISIPGVIAGVGLLNFRPWARILMIIISVLDLPGVPFHTALGLYGLWVLLNRETEALFSRPVMPYQQSQYPQPPYPRT